MSIKLLQKRLYKCEHLQLLHFSAVKRVQKLDFKICIYSRAAFLNFKLVFNVEVVHFFPIEDCKTWSILILNLDLNLKLSKQFHKYFNVPGHYVMSNLGYLNPHWSLSKMGDSILPKNAGPLKSALKRDPSSRPLSNQQKAVRQNANSTFRVPEGLRALLNDITKEVRSKHLFVILSCSTQPLILWSNPTFHNETTKLYFTIGSFLSF